MADPSRFRKHSIDALSQVLLEPQAELLADTALREAAVSEMRKRAAAWESRTIAAVQQLIDISDDDAVKAELQALITEYQALVRKVTAEKCDEALSIRNSREKTDAKDQLLVKESVHTM